jgi:hypothetical protein
MSPPDADTPAGLSEVDLERSLKGTPRPVPTSPPTRASPAMTHPN